MNRMFVIPVGTLIGLAIACSSNIREAQNASEVKVVNGTEAQKVDFPYIVRLTVKPVSDTTDEAVCTGVVISHRTVLAASHCVKRLETDPSKYHDIIVEGGPATSGNTINADTAYTYQFALSADIIKENNVGHDLAVVDFPANTFTSDSVAKVAFAPSKVGDKVKLMGYGATSFNNPSDPNGLGDKLNVGENKLNDVLDNRGYLLLTGSTSDAANGVNALAAQGDSGGPLFNSNNELIGIGSALQIEGDRVTNYFVDLASPMSKSLIGHYLTDGLKDTGSNLVTGFDANEVANFDPETEITPDTARDKTLTAMCGHGRKRGNNRRGKSNNDDLRSGKGSGKGLSVDLGKGSGRKTSGSGSSSEGSVKKNKDGTVTIKF